MDRILKVEASGLGKIKPNQIEISIVISRKSEVYEDAINSINEDLETMLQALSEIGIDRDQTKTTSLRISNDYENYEENGTWKNKHIGYVATHQLKVKIDYVASNFAETSGTFYSADLMRGAFNAKASPDILVDEIVVRETVEISWSIE